jgi:putative flippase GtrA
LLLGVPTPFPETAGFFRLRRLATQRIVRFGCVGLAVTLFFMGLNKALALVFGLGPQAAFLASYPPALALHFGLNKWWTFGDRRATSSRHVGDYLFSVVATFLIQWPAFVVLHGVFQIRGWIAAGGANAIQMVASYFLLKQRVFNPGIPGEAGGSRSSWHRLALLLTTVAVSALLAWTSLGEWSFPRLGPRQYDYFNYLVSGFRNGSLALDIEVPAELIASKNPYNPAERPPGVAPHDVSYYKGRYYIYFGVVPVVTLFWPFRLLAGCDLSMTYAAILYGVGAFWIAAWLWTRVARDHFPEASLATKLAGLMAVGIAGGQLVVARRTSFWEIPIEAGYFHMVCTAAASYLALRGRRPRLCLGAAGLSLGLAVGCRPTLIGAAAGLAWIAVWIAIRSAPAASGSERLRRLAHSALAAGLPFGAVLVGLFGYNAARFGNPLEFGLRYQLTASEDQTTTRPFSMSYVLFNLRTYFLAAPQWGRYFPFVHPFRSFPQPAGYYGVEFTYGALVVCPLTWFCGLIPPLIFQRKAKGPFPLAVFFVLLALGTTGVLVFFNSVAGRYVDDFLPWWVWVGVLAAAALENKLREDRHPSAAAAASWLFALAAAFSGAVAFFQSADLHGIFQFENPAGYLRVSRFFDRPAALVERVTGQNLGDLEMDVVFPEHVDLAMMPLVVTGVSYETDYIFALFSGPGRLRFGYLTSGGRPLMSDEIALTAGRAYHLRVAEGSLFPPAGHPVYDGWRSSEVRAMKDWAVISVDGRTVLSLSGQAHEASPGTVQIGRDSRLGICGRRFAGRITNVRRDPLRRPPNGENGRGDVSLEVTFPPEADAQVQPLVVLGRTGLADLIGMRMAGMGRFSLYYESWGGGTAESAPMPVPVGREASLRFRMGSAFLGASDPASVAMSRSIVVWMDGLPLWWTKEMREIGADPAFDIAVNAIGSSAMIPYFKGRIRGWTRDLAPPWRPGAFRTLVLQLGGRGSGSEPLITTGIRGAADTLAVEWLPDGQARLHYDHWGAGEISSPPFPWMGEKVHVLSVSLPSFPHLDDGRMPNAGEGLLNAAVDGSQVWAAVAHFYSCRSDSLSIGRNLVGSTIAAPQIGCVVADVRQVGIEAGPVAR